MVAKLSGIKMLQNSEAVISEKPVVASVPLSAVGNTVVNDRITAIPKVNLQESQVSQVLSMLNTLSTKIPESNRPLFNAILSQVSKQVLDFDLPSGQKINLSTNAGRTAVYDTLTQRNALSSKYYQEKAVLNKLQG